MSPDRGYLLSPLTKTYIPPVSEPLQFALFWYRITVEAAVQFASAAKTFAAVRL